MEEVLLNVLRVMAGLLWVVIPIILFAVFWRSYLWYIRRRYVSNFQWVLLRLTVPQEVVKTPLAMEQVFAGLHGELFKGGWYVRYIQGRKQEWYSVEIVSIGGKVAFYIRIPALFRNIVESSIYAQYPDAEISEAEDYTFNVPHSLPNKEFDIFGTEFVLAKPSAYPIRTYADFAFETKDGKGNVDPFAAIIEALSRLREGEQIWLQMRITALDDEWKKEGDEILGKMLGREHSRKRSAILDFVSREAGAYARGLPQAPFGPLSPAEEERAGETGPSAVSKLTPGERDVVEAVERKLSKVGFEVSMRGVYIAPREIHNIRIFFSVAGMYRQFSTQHLNAFKYNGDATTFVLWPFREQRERYRKKRLLHRYREREHGLRHFILNIEELATVFHFPGSIVSIPALPRIPTKKAEAPPNLPTY
jgi:hypothetical protein